MSTAEFYTILSSDLSAEEIEQFLTYKKLKYLKTIKNCTLFFTILTIIGIAASIIMILSTI